MLRASHIRRASNVDIHNLVKSLKEKEQHCIRDFASPQAVASIDADVRNGIDAAEIFHDYKEEDPSGALANKLLAISQEFLLTALLPMVPDEWTDEIGTQTPTYQVYAQTLAPDRMFNKVKKFHLDEGKPRRHIVFSLTYIVTRENNHVILTPAKTVTTRIKVNDDQQNVSFVSCDDDTGNRYGATMFDPTTTVHRGASDEELNRALELVRLTCMTQFSVDPTWSRADDINLLQACQAARKRRNSNSVQNRQRGYHMNGTSTIAASSARLNSLSTNSRSTQAIQHRNVGGRQATLLNASKRTLIKHTNLGILIQPEFTNKATENSTALGRTASMRSQVSANSFVNATRPDNLRRLVQDVKMFAQSLGDDADGAQEFRTIISDRISLEVNVIQKHITRTSMMPYDLIDRVTLAWVALTSDFNNKTKIALTPGSSDAAWQAVGDAKSARNQFRNDLLQACGTLSGGGATRRYAQRKSVTSPRRKATASRRVPR